MEVCDSANVYLRISMPDCNKVTTTPQLMFKGYVWGSAGCVL
jgi:hypothetical protein